MSGILKVGLTGGIACGRSTLSAHLRRPGWLLLDADEIVHGLLSPGGAAVEEVLKAFGPGVRTEAGAVDRSELGRIVFGDRGARRNLEAIVHPHVYRAIDEETASFARRARSGIVVVDAALMVETGSWRRYHRLVVAHCDPEVQLRRLMARDGIDAGRARSRIAAQAPLSEKLSLADYTIDTGGTMEQTRAVTVAVAELLEADMRAMEDGVPPPRRRPA